MSEKIKVEQSMVAEVIAEIEFAKEHKISFTKLDCDLLTKRDYITIAKETETEVDHYAAVYDGGEGNGSANYHTLFIFKRFGIYLECEYITKDLVTTDDDFVHNATEQEE